MWLPATEQREDRDAGRKTTRGAAVQPPRERLFKGRGRTADRRGRRGGAVCRIGAGGRCLARLGLHRRGTRRAVAARARVAGGEDLKSGSIGPGRR